MRETAPRTCHKAMRRVGSAQEYLVNRNSNNVVPRLWVGTPSGLLLAVSARYARASL